MSNDDSHEHQVPLIKGTLLLQRVKPHLADNHTYNNNHTWLPLYISIISAFVVTVLYLIIMTFRRMYSNVKTLDENSTIGEDQPLRKVRCTSMCVDMEGINRNNHMKSNRSHSFDSGVLSRHSIKTSPLIHSQGSQSDASLRDMPTEVLMRIFGYLTPESKNSVARSCSRFSKLIRQGDVWTMVDLTTFPRPMTHMSKSYDRQVRCYLRYLTAIRPKLEVFRMSVDFFDAYQSELTEFVKSIRGRRLRIAHLNWTIPVVPTEDRNKIYQFRRRMRLFYHFFKHLAHVAPNLRHLVTPYDWSDGFLRHLTAMKNLRTLVLQRVSSFETNFSKNSVQQVLSVLTHIVHLELSVNHQTPGGYFSLVLQSNSLIELDIGQTSGIYLSKVDMPYLRRLRVSSRPWNRIPLIDNGGQLPTAPCMVGVLAKGAPSLLFINDSSVESDDAKTLVCSVCACDKHKDKLWIPMNVAS